MVGLSQAGYRQAALGDFTPSESAIASFRPYPELVTGSDDAYQHPLRLRNAAAKPQIERLQEKREERRLSRNQPKSS
jgi:hypothetical protein